MAKIAIKVRRNADGTGTVRIKRPGSAHWYIEHLDLENLGPLDTYEAVRWACITAGVPVDESTAEELYRIVKGLQPE